MNQEKKQRTVLIGEASKRREGERSEPKRSEEASPIAVLEPFPGQQESPAPDPEVPEKAKRRRYSARYKQRILKEADQCEPGQVGALLRREGLYWSNLQTWRRQREEGTLAALTPKKRGRKAAPKNPLTGRVKELERENRQLRRKLQRAQIMLEIQKKVSALLGIPLAQLESENEEDD